MVRVFEGRPAKGARVALICSRFNEPICERLLEGAKACLAHHAASDGCLVVRVPGAWELAAAAERVAVAGKVDAIVALGALIRGETIHFEVLAHQAARGLAAVGERHGLPVAFGVLTTDNGEQALARSERGPSNKGWQATRAALEMVALHRELGRPGES